MFIARWRWLNTARTECVLLLACLIVFWSPFTGGARLPSGLLAIMGGTLLWQSPYLHVPPIAQQRLLWICALLWCPALLSLPITIDLRSSVLIVVALPFYALMGLALLHGLRTDQRLRWLERSVGACVLLWMVDGWLQYLFGLDVLGMPLDADGRVVGFFHGLRLPVFLSVLAPVLLWPIATSRPWLSGALYVLIAPIVVLSGFRSAWVMIALVGVLLLWHLSLSRRVKCAMGIVILAMILAIGATSALVRSKGVQSIAADTACFEAVDRIGSGRMTIWATAARMIRDRPWLGVGAGAFREAYDRYSTRPDDPFRSQGEQPISHVHHLYLGVAAETGLIGLLGLIGIWGICLRAYWRSTPTQRISARPWAIALVIAVFPVNSQPVFSAWWFPVLLLLLAALLSALSLPEKA